MERNTDSTQRKERVLHPSNLERKPAEKTHLKAATLPGVGQRAYPQSRNPASLQGLGPWRTSPALKPDQALPSVCPPTELELGKQTPWCRPALNRTVHQCPVLPQRSAGLWGPVTGPLHFTGIEVEQNGIAEALCMRTSTPGASALQDPPDKRPGLRADPVQGGPQRKASTLCLVADTNYHGQRTESMQQ